MPSSVTVRNGLQFRSRPGVSPARQLAEAMATLPRVDLLVGFPVGGDARKPEPGEPPSPINNATIAFIQEKGSPEAHIPARPFLSTGIADYVPRMVERMAQTARKVVEGDVDAIRRGFNTMGLEAVSAIRNRLTAGPWTPLADATLLKRAGRPVGGGVGIRKGALAELARRAQGLAPSTLYARPLVETGQLRNAVTYVIRPR